MDSSYNNVGDEQLENLDEVREKAYAKGFVDTVAIVAYLGVLYSAYNIWLVIPKFTEIFQSLKVDLPLPTVLVLEVSRNLSLLPVFAGLSIFIIQYVKKRGSRQLAVIVMVVMLLIGPIAYESVMLPLYKIQDALRKK